MTSVNSSEARNDQRLLVVAAHDSQLKVASAIADGFGAAGWTQEVRIVRSAGREISTQQIADYSSFDRFEYCSDKTEDILRGCMDFSAILIILSGKLTLRICHTFYTDLAASGASTRPVIITGFVGVGLFDTYIGYQRRLLSDVLFLNAEKDLEDCLAVCDELQIQHGGLVVSGLPFIGALDKSAVPPSEIKTVLFAGQPDVPTRIVERLFMLERMFDYARAFPDRTVLFKPRHRPNERTLHKTAYHYETLLENFIPAGDVPPNFKLVYGPIPGYLDESQMVITISSTVILEAIERNIHAVLLSDLGISADYGNSYFMGSGLLCSLDDLLQDKFPVLDWDWLERHLNVAGEGPDAIVAATQRAIDNNAANMSSPYQLERLERQLSNRMYVEHYNATRVRKPWAIIKFFLRRAIKDRRII